VKHKFKVGQRVDFMPNKIELVGSAREYEIMRLLPSEDGQLQYRIKTSSETFERVAKESQLSPRR
jgi:hypothetical protein